MFRKKDKKDKKPLISNPSQPEQQSEGPVRLPNVIVKSDTGIKVLTKEAICTSITSKQTIDNSELDAYLKDNDINAVIVNGNTMLHLAILHQQTDLISYLLEKGANPNIKNSSQLTPIHIAISHSDDKNLVELLVEHGANIEEVDSQSKSALSYAVGSQRTDIFTYLLSKNANVNHRDKNLMTPVNYIICKGENTSAKEAQMLQAMLATHKINFDLKFQWGTTFIDYPTAALLNKNATALNLIEDHLFKQKQTSSQALEQKVETLEQRVKDLEIALGMKNNDNNGASNVGREVVTDNSQLLFKPGK